MKHVVFAMLTVFLLCSVAIGQIPHVVSHQGYLEDSTGTGVTGVRPMTFRMFNDSTGGTPVFIQSFPEVALTKGVFSVNLDVSSLSFSSQYWLETEVDNETLNPRTRLTSAPYSLAPWVTTGANLYYLAGNVGIGTTTPYTTLDVNGSALIGGAFFGTGELHAPGNIGVGTDLPATSGVDNTAVGQVAMYYSTTGEQNTAIGTHSLLTNVTGSLNTVLGANADVAVDGLTNATAVGANAKAGASNSLVLGDNANVGIGTSTPVAKLDVVGNVKISDGTQGDGKVLTSNGDGVATWATTVRAGSYTPAWTSVSGITNTPNNIYARYTRVGDVVTVVASFDFTVITAGVTNKAYITLPPGLPVAGGNLVFMVNGTFTDLNYINSTLEHVTGAVGYRNSSTVNLVIQNPNISGAVTSACTFSYVTDAP